jgi:hypothetical protein
MSPKRIVSVRHVCPHAVEQQQLGLQRNFPLHFLVIRGGEPRLGRTRALQTQRLEAQHTTDKMIPLSLNRAHALFASPLPLEEFLKTVHENFHYWRDAELVEETARASFLKTTVTGEAQTFIVRIRKADEDAGLEFLSLRFGVELSRIRLQSVE